MYSKPIYYSLIHEYFVLRFHFQYYKYGDILPSVETLRQKFCVSAQTVKNAMKRLRDEGYITTDRLKCKVIFQQSPEETEAYIQSFFLERAAALPDLLQSMTVIFSDMLIKGLTQVDKEDRACLSLLAGRAADDDIICFFYNILKKSNNPLALNLFWEISIFLGFSLYDCKKQPQFLDHDLSRQKLKDIVAQAQMQDMQAAHNTMHAFQNELLRGVASFNELNRSAVKAADQYPFVWRLYHDRPQKCYSLAMWLLHHIYMGDYKDASYLPSYQKMAEITGASVSTIRRTVSLLSQLGAAVPVNGKGIRIFSVHAISCTPDLSDPKVRHVMINFYQAFEIVSYSCGAVTPITLQALTAEAKKEFIKDLDTYSKSKLYDSSFWRYLICIATHCPLAAVREVYGKIYSLFLLGNILKVSFGIPEDLDMELKKLSESMLKNLSNEDYHAFTKEITGFTYKELPLTEKFLIASGITPEELHPSASIRFILSEEI